MILFAEAAIPYRLAHDVSMTTRRSSLLDINAMTKSAIADLLYDGAIRPWRLTGSPAADDARTDDRAAVIHVQGIILNRDKAAEFSGALRECGGSIKITEWDVKDGDIVTCDVKASPRRATTVRDPATGHARRVELNPVREGQTPQEAYEGWLTRTFSQPRVGGEIAGKIHILSTRGELHVVGHKLMPTAFVHALVDVEVRNADAFRMFLRSGVGALKHIGFGSVFPLEIANA